MRSTPAWSSGRRGCAFARGRRHRPPRGLRHRQRVAARGAWGATRFGVGERVHVRQVLLRRNAEHSARVPRPATQRATKVKSLAGRHQPRPRTRRRNRRDESALADIGTTVMDDIDEAPVIVYRPTRHPIPGSVAPTEVAVLSPIVAVHMSTTDRPLNVKPDEPYVCVINHSAVQEPRICRPCRPRSRVTGR